MTRLASVLTLSLLVGFTNAFTRFAHPARSKLYAVSSKEEAVSHDQLMGIRYPS